jgi:hypothetical protein
MALLVAAVIALTPLPGVVTPSGNIHCFYVPAKPAHLLCDIHRSSYAAREEAACQTRAGLDWHGWEVYAVRRPAPACSGGILYDSDHDKPAYRRLPYGRTWKFAAFTCVSRIGGLTCTSGAGHGLFVSRQSWRAW